MTDFISLDSKITADGECRHKIKRHLFHGRQAVTNLDSVFKSRDITLLTKVHVVMYGCDSWTIKKADCQRIDAFELWYWRRLLRVPWTARRSNPSILNIHWKDWCWGWSSSTLATWCKELTHWKRLWCWERLRAGGDGNEEDEMVGWHHWLDGHEFEQALGDSEEQGVLVCCSPWGHKELDTTEQYGRY